MMRKIFRKQIKALKFTLLSPEQVKKLSSVKVVTPELYDIDGFPVDGGLMDLRLGAIDPGVRCRTCGKRVKECPHCNENIERTKLDKPTNFHADKKRLSPIEIRERLVLIPDDELKKIG